MLPAFFFNLDSNSFTAEMYSEGRAAGSTCSRETTAGSDVLDGELATGAAAGAGGGDLLFNFSFNSVISVRALRNSSRWSCRSASLRLNC